MALAGRGWGRGRRARPAPLGGDGGRGLRAGGAVSGSCLGSFGPRPPFSRAGVSFRRPWRARFVRRGGGCGSWGVLAVPALLRPAPQDSGPGGSGAPGRGGSERMSLFPPSRRRVEGGFREVLGQSQGRP